jgi:hypothetical protein
VYRLRSISLVLGLLVFCASAFAQQVPATIYVTDGSGGHIYSFAPPSTAATLLTSFTARTLEGIVYGPDQKLYVCDPGHGTIWRVDPTSVSTALTHIIVFQSIGTGLQKPQCGRFSSTGDFYVTDETAGAGIYKFTAASLAGTLPTTPVNVLGSTQLGATFGGDADLTQANTGDLLAVDSTDGKLFLSPAPAYALASAIVTGLDHATGIARSSTGDIFIAQKGAANKISRYSSTGALIGPCGTFTGGNQPFFLKFTADDTLYVTTSKFDSDDHIDPYNTGKIWKVNISSCASAPVLFATMPRPPGEPHDEPLAAIGIALTPTSTVTKSATFASSKVFNFGFTSMQINATGNCTVSVKATQTPLTALNTLLATVPVASLPAGATQIPYLGEAGFGTLFQVDPGTGGCTPTSALIGAFTDPSVFTNPRLIQCDGGTCVVDTTTGIYPLGGPIPGDGSVGGKVPNFSQFFLVNAGVLTTAVGGNSPGTFCGFNFPLNTTQDPAQARLFDDDDLILVSFRLAKAGGNCTWGPFVDNAQVLVSLAQIAPTFIPITDPNIVVTPNINGAGILHTYFGLIKVHGLPLGTYGLSLVFTTNNSPVVTTLFKVVPPGTPGSF